MNTSPELSRVVRDYLFEAGLLKEDVVYFEEVWNKFQNSERAYQALNRTTIRDQNSLKKCKLIVLSEAEAEYIKKYYYEGCSIITHKLSIEGGELTNRKKKFNKKEESVKELLSKGLGVKEITELLEIPTSTCYRIIKKIEAKNK